MKPEEYRDLYELLRLYQLTDTKQSVRLWKLCEELLIHLRPTYYSQNRETTK